MRNLCFALVTATLVAMSGKAVGDPVADRVAALEKIVALQQAEIQNAKKKTQLIEENQQIPLGPTNSPTERPLLSGRISRAGTYLVIGTINFSSGGDAGNTIQGDALLKFGQEAYPQEATSQTSRFSGTCGITGFSAAGVTMVIWKGALKAGDMVFLGAATAHQGAVGYINSRKLLIQEID